MAITRSIKIHTRTAAVLFYIIGICILCKEENITYHYHLRLLISILHRLPINYIKWQMNHKDISPKLYKFQEWCHCMIEWQQLPHRVPPTIKSTTHQKLSKEWFCFYNVCSIELLNLAVYNMTRRIYVANKYLTLGRTISIVRWKVLGQINCNRKQICLFYWSISKFQVRTFKILNFPATNYGQSKIEHPKSRVDPWCLPVWLLTTHALTWYSLSS